MLLKPQQQSRRALSSVLPTFLCNLQGPKALSPDSCVSALVALSQERLKHEEALEANNGVWWSARLRVLPLDEGAAAQKGIKRGADKVTCP